MPIAPKSESHEPSPWWHHRMMWLVLGGPFLVVLAAIATAVIAVRGADTVLEHEAAAERATMPAVQGRNHAATPDVAKP